MYSSIDNKRLHLTLPREGAARGVNTQHQIELKAPEGKRKILQSSGAAISPRLERRARLRRRETTRVLYDDRETGKKIGIVIRIMNIS